MFNAGQILRMCRKHEKISRLTLSAESLVSTSTIEEIENNRRDCRIGTFNKLLNAMGYELEVLKIDE